MFSSDRAPIRFKLGKGNNTRVWDKEDLGANVWTPKAGEVLYFACKILRLPSPD